MRALKEKHFHEYQRSTRSKEYYRCIHPECTHYMHREFIIGKRVICYNCKTPFIATKAQCKNKFMRCDLCNASPKSEVAKMAKDLMDRALKELEDRKEKEEIEEMGKI